MIFLYGEQGRAVLPGTLSEVARKDRRERLARAVSAGGGAFAGAYVGGPLGLIVRGLVGYRLGKEARALAELWRPTGRGRR